MYRSYVRGIDSYNSGRYRYNPYTYFSDFWAGSLVEYYYGDRRRNRRSTNATVPAVDRGRGASAGRGGRRRGGRGRGGRRRIGRAGRGSRAGRGGRAGGEDVDDEPEDELEDELEDKPEAPKEELAKVLKVEEIDLKIQANAAAHRTNKYEVTEKRKDDDGKEQEAELVIRRGQGFDIALTFDAPYDKDKHDMRLSMSYGDEPLATRGTYIEFKLDESGSQKFKPNEWGATLKSQKANTINVEVNVPANCIVGEWDIDVQSYSEGKDKDGKEVKLKFIRECDVPIYILFNPWCKDDGTWMSDEKLLEEYVLEQEGIVYQGSAYNINPKYWIFGQFDEAAFKAAMQIMDIGFLKNDSKGKADPVKVARRIAHKVNDDVLVGNWSGDYDGGVKPWVWQGSVPILQKYLETKEAVKYGQCWVFSCLTTTVCRALGIPCRSVTNFASAHDTDGSNTIDKFFNEEGDEIELAHDSVWNFHVWNEAWMSRPDLYELTGPGWQVIDATPQEESIGFGDWISGYTCGPCPVQAVRIGNCRVNFDCGFIFAEVNADRVQWQVSKDQQMTVMKITKNAVGKNISTKKALSRWERQDLTLDYKHPEGSEEERLSVLHAYETARFKRPGLYDPQDMKKDIDFKFSHENDIMVGSDVEVDLKAISSSTEDRVVLRAAFKFMPKTYRGHVGEPFFKKEFNDVKIPAGSSDKVFSVKITAEEYIPVLFEKGGVSLDAFILVEKTGSAPEWRTLKTRDFVFTMPKLGIQGPAEAKVGDTVEYVVTLTNPLNFPMTKCELVGESSAFTRWDKRDVKDIPANGEMKETFKFDVKKKGEHNVLFELDTKEIPDITGASTIKITA